MTKYFTNNFPILNLYKKTSLKSEIVTQMIFGDSFSIFGRKRNWLRIKIKEDGYKGYIKNKHFPNFLKPTHKVNILKAKVYKYSNKRNKLHEITFGSKIKVLGKQILGSFLVGADSMFHSGFITEHEKLMSEKLGYVISGGDLSAPTLVSEQYLLDLEREAILSLTGEQKTLERIEHMLKSGKPLRN